MLLLGQRVHRTYSNKVFICDSANTCTIGMQVGAGFQEIRRNMLHHPTKKAQNERVLAHLVEDSGARSLPLKNLKISHR